MRNLRRGFLAPVTPPRYGMLRSALDRAAPHCLHPMRVSLAGATPCKRLHLRSHLCSMQRAPSYQERPGS
eukprot:scaffold15577_cov35-Tisochrysis_lutea.AAC.2